MERQRSRAELKVKQPERMILETTSVRLSIAITVALDRSPDARAPNAAPMRFLLSASALTCAAHAY